MKNFTDFSIDAHFLLSNKRDIDSLMEHVNILKCLGFMWHNLALQQLEQGELQRAKTSLKESRQNMKE